MHQSQFSNLSLSLSLYKTFLFIITTPLTYRTDSYICKLSTLSLSLSLSLTHTQPIQTFLIIKTLLIYKTHPYICVNPTTPTTQNLNDQNQQNPQHPNPQNSNKTQNQILTPLPLTTNFPHNQNTPR